MIKEELNRQIELLKTSLEAHEEQVKDLQHDLKTATQRLEDVDKPKLTNKQFSKLHEVIENSNKATIDSLKQEVMEIGWELDSMMLKYDYGFAFTN